LGGHIPPNYAVAKGVVTLHEHTLMSIYQRTKRNAAV
jgi:hypothetical protein